MPFISVVIPTCHRNEQLAECLNRLAPGYQTLDPAEYEVLVTDDGSRSTAESMIRDRYPWARWVAGPRRGPAANRNNGARAARGEWIVFTDDDCLPSDRWLSAYLAGHRTGIEVYEGRTCSPSAFNILEEAPINEKGGCLWSCNLMFSRVLFERLGGFDEDFQFWCEDMELNSRLRRLGIPTSFVPQAIVEHPVRRRPLGWRAGARWEARVLLWLKEGNHGSLWSWMPVHLLRFRLGQIRRTPFSLRSVTALGSALVEFACVVVHLHSWDRKYRALMAQRDPSFHLPASSGVEQPTP